MPGLELLQYSTKLSYKVRQQNVAWPYNATVYTCHSILWFFSSLFFLQIVRFWKIRQLPFLIFREARRYFFRCAVHQNLAYERVSIWHNSASTCTIHHTISHIAVSAEKGLNNYSLCRKSEPGFLRYDVSAIEKLSWICR